MGEVMRWTTEPTVDGYYWARACADGEAFIVEVSEGRAMHTGLSNSYPLSDYTHWWGPLAQPAERSITGLQSADGRTREIVAEDGDLVVVQKDAFAVKPGEVVRLNGALHRVKSAGDGAGGMLFVELEPFAP